MKFPSHLNCDGKIVSEMGPWSSNCDTFCTCHDTICKIFRNQYVKIYMRISCNFHQIAVFKISARPQTLIGKIWVGPASFPSLSYINFGKIGLRQVSDLILKTEIVIVMEKSFKKEVSLSVRCSLHHASLTKIMKWYLRRIYWGLTQINVLYVLALRNGYIIIVLTFAEPKQQALLNFIAMVHLKNCHCICSLVDLARNYWSILNSL